MHKSQTLAKHELNFETLIKMQHFVYNKDGAGNKYLFVCLLVLFAIDAFSVPFLYILKIWANFDMT